MKTNKYYLSLMLLLFAYACKKKDAPANPYAWVNDYCGKYNVLVHVSFNQVNSGGGSKYYDAIASITNMNTTAVPTVPILHSTDKTSPRPKVMMIVEGNYSLNKEMFIEITDTGAYFFQDPLTFGSISNQYLDYKQLQPATSNGSTSVYITGYKVK